MTPSYVVAGFLVRGQASSFDSQASINIRRKRGEGMGCMPPKHGKGEIREGGPALLHRKGCVYRKPKLKMKREGGLMNGWMDVPLKKARRKLSHN